MPYLLVDPYITQTNLYMTSRFRVTTSLKCFTELLQIDTELLACDATNLKMIYATNL
jgi:hypothetical protein